MNRNAKAALARRPFNDYDPPEKKFNRGNAMMITRRALSNLATGALTLSLAPRMARAGAYPDHPVRLVVTFPPGGANDMIARLLGQALSDRLGQQFVIDNRVGGGGNIGAEAVVRAPPDGYTLLQATVANTTNTTLYADNLNFNFVRDVTPIAGIYSVPLVLVVQPTFPTRDLGEFIAYAKSNPGKISYGSGGVGTLAHISGELFDMMAGVKMVHVPYRGSPAELADLMAGRIEIAFDPLPTSLPFIQDGRLRALAVTTATRAEALPNVPTVAETLPGYDAMVWVGLAAPRGAPDDLIGKLNAEVNAILSSPAFRARLRDLGAAPLELSPAGFGKLIANDTERWAKTIMAAGIKVQ